MSLLRNNVDDKLSNQTLDMFSKYNVYLSPLDWPRDLLDVNQFIDRHRLEVLCQLVKLNAPIDAETLVESSYTTKFTLNGYSFMCLASLVASGTDVKRVYEELVKIYTEENRSVMLKMSDFVFVCQLVALTSIDMIAKHKGQFMRSFEDYRDRVKIYYRILERQLPRTKNDIEMSDLWFKLEREADRLDDLRVLKAEVGWSDCYDCSYFMTSLALMYRRHKNAIKLMALVSKNLDDRVYAQSALHLMTCAILNQSDVDTLIDVLCVRLVERSDEFCDEFRQLYVEGF